MKVPDWVPFAVGLGLLALWTFGWVIFGIYLLFTGANPWYTIGCVVMCYVGGYLLGKPLASLIFHLERKFT